MALVDGIKYQRLGDEQYYAQELFETQELTGYLKNHRWMQKSRSTNTLSTTQASSATLLSQLWRRTTQSRYMPNSQLVQGTNTARQLQSRLGRTYRTRRSGAAVLRGGNQEQPYSTEDLRDREGGKIKCGNSEHFKALAINEKPGCFGKFTDVQVPWGFGDSR
jgi:type III restriction enzyme